MRCAVIEVTRRLEGSLSISSASRSLSLCTARWQMISVPPEASWTHRVSSRSASDWARPSEALGTHCNRSAHTVCPTGRGLSLLDDTEPGRLAQPGVAAGDHLVGDAQH